MFFQDLLVCKAIGNSQNPTLVSTARNSPKSFTFWLIHSQLQIWRPTLQKSTNVSWSLKTLKDWGFSLSNGSLSYWSHSPRIFLWLGRCGLQRNLIRFQTIGSTAQIVRCLAGHADMYGKNSKKSMKTMNLLTQTKIDLRMWIARAIDIHWASALTISYPSNRWGGKGFRPC